MITRKITKNKVNIKLYFKTKLIPVVLSAVVGLSVLGVLFFVVENVNVQFLVFAGKEDHTASCSDIISPSDYSRSDVSTRFSISPRAALVASGTCGDGVTWSLDDEGLLTVSGSGSITSFPWQAANYKRSIKYVQINNGVTSIPRDAFYTNDTIISVTMANSVTSIGRGAFYGCNNLEKVKLSNSLTSIGQDAFHSNYRLKKIVIPPSVTSIGASPFYLCTDLTDIYYKGTEAQWRLIGGYANVNTNNSAVIHFVCYSDDTHDWKWEYDDTTHSRVCQICGDMKNSEPHSFTNYVPDKAATCTEDGTETSKCDRCDATDTRRIPALGHHYDENGKCKDCDETDPLHNNDKNDNEENKIPGTGDSFNPALWIVLLIVSGAAAYTVIVKFKKQKNA